MPLSKEEQKRLELEDYRKELKLEPNQTQNRKMIELAFETESKKLLLARMDEKHRQEELMELKQARDELLKASQTQNSQARKQVIRNTNLQALQQEEASLEQITVQDDMGRSITVGVDSASNKPIEQLGAQNGLYLLPKLTMQAGGKQITDEKAQSISLEAAHKLADQQKIPIQPNFNKAGQLQFFTTTFKLDEQQKQALLKQFLSLAMQTLKLNLTQQAQQQKGTAPSPFVTTPIRK